MKRFVRLGLVASMASVGATVGCSNDDTSTTTGVDSGTGLDANSGGNGGTQDSGAEPDAPAVGSLYTRLGGHSGIRSAIEAIVADELKDPEVASFFVFQTDAKSHPGHPTADQLEECLTNQLGKAAGGTTEVFPGPLGADKGGFVCRDMKTIHAPFHISGSTFDKFVTIAAGTLTKLKVPAADITTIGSVLNSTKSDIVDPAALAGSSFDAGASPPDAAATTLYTRLGGHAGIRAAVEKIVGDELKDPVIASFFVFQTDGKPHPGHPTADQLEECLTNQLGKAAGGLETFPGALEASKGSFVCRDMKTIHAVLHISGSTFDKFVMIAANTLTGLGVASPDITTIGAVLNSTKPDIVDTAAPDGGAFDAGTD